MFGSLAFVAELVKQFVALLILKWTIRTSTQFQAHNQVNEYISNEKKINSDEPHISNNLLYYLSDVFILIHVFTLISILNVYRSNSAFN